MLWPRTAILLLWLLSVPTMAIEELALEAGGIEGKGWRAEGLSVSLHWDARKDLAPSLQLHVQHLTLAPPVGRVTKVHLSCPKVEWTPDRVYCPQFRLRANHPWLGRKPTTGGFTYHRQTGALDLTLHLPALMGGRVDLELVAKEEGWTLTLDAHTISLSRLMTLVPFAQGDQTLGAQLASTLDGRLDLKGRFRAEFTSSIKGKLDGAVEALGFSDNQGLHAADGVKIGFEAEFRHRGPRTTAKLALKLKAGELLADPLYLDLNQAPLEAHGELDLDQKTGNWRFTKLRLRDPYGNRVEGDLRLTPGGPVPLQNARVRLHAQFPRAYEGYLRPLVQPATGLDLDTEGSLDLVGEITAPTGSRPEHLRLEGNLKEFRLVERLHKFGLYGLAARLDWDNSGAAKQSTLRWEGGNLYKIPIGPTKVEVRTRAYDLALEHPLRVPVLDGRLDIDRFSMADVRNPQSGWDLDAVLTPVSLQRLTTALGWPTLSGKVSAVVPTVHFQDHVLGIGGAVLVRVFDGNIVFRHLRLTRPLGALPQLTGDLEIDDLDLDTLTAAFAFGRILGKLQGRVRGLVLEDWRPVAFDARFETPTDDTGRHRISQQAVDNLSSLGGGAGAISRGLLGMFENFSYRRLGIGCRLADGVCTMSGVRTKPGGGYYLVEGGGIPRIDVVGYSQRVDWDTLLERLRRVTAARTDATPLGPVPRKGP